MFPKHSNPVATPTTETIHYQPTMTSSMRSLTSCLAVACVVAPLVSHASTLSTDLCFGECTGSGDEKVCVFRVSLDIFASETGYFKFNDCDGVQPTLGMLPNVTYVFEQTDKTNWFHPMGFAYGADGALRGNPELEKGEVPPGGEPCGTDTTPTCQYPQYMLDDTPLCDNSPCDAEDFGLDQYEGVHFSGKRDAWLDAGKFSIQVKITDEATTNFFYFCHIHNSMSGRIVMIDEDSNPLVNVDDLAPLPYDYYAPSEFDAQCGTHNISVFRDVSKVCPDMTFLCADKLDLYGECMQALDCAMHVEMRVQGDRDPTTTFMHQMIAHHRNAVNMAKTLLKTAPASLPCGLVGEGACDTEAESDTYVMMWEIINGQNAQITFMRGWLAENEEPAFDFCEHEQDSHGHKNSIGVAIGAVLAVAGLALV